MTNKEKINVILIAGYAWSGSGAIKDLLKEFQSYKVFNPEFRLITDPGGIIDLENALLHNRSLTSVNMAIKRFMRLVTIYGRKFHWSRVKLSQIFSEIGFNFNLFMNNQFYYLSNRYIQKIVNFKYRGGLITDYYELSRFSFFLLKLRFFFFKILGKKVNIAKTIYISAPEYDYFLTTTRDYLYSLCEEISKGSKAKNIVLDQAILPSNIDRGLTYFYSPKLIIVDRDPRDIFVQVYHSPYFTSIPIENVNDYIKWFRFTRFMSKGKEFENVLRIRFEESVINYEETVNRIIQFLGEDPTIHKNIKKYFDPSISIKNIGLWKSHPKQADIREIENKLGEFCWKG